MTREEHRFIIFVNLIAGKGGLPQNFEELRIEGLPVHTPKVVLGFFFLLPYDFFHKTLFCWVEKNVNIW